MTEIQSENVIGSVRGVEKNELLDENENYKFIKIFHWCVFDEIRVISLSM